MKTTFRKIFAALLAAIICVSLCGCSVKDGGAKSDGSLSADPGKELAASVYEGKVEEPSDPLSQFRMEFNGNTTDHLQADRYIDFISFLSELGTPCCYATPLPGVVVALVRNGSKYFRVGCVKFENFEILDDCSLIWLTLGTFIGEETEVQTLEIDGNEFSIYYRKDRAFLVKEINAKNDMNIVIAEEIGILDKFLMENFDK